MNHFALAFTIFYFFQAWSLNAETHIRPESASTHEISPRIFGQFLERFHAKPSDGELGVESAAAAAQLEQIKMPRHLSGPWRSRRDSNPEPSDP